MKQLIPFNIEKGGTTPNLCLNNVRLGYGIPNLYSSAWEAWLHTEQHTDPIPEGLDVPVYFSYWATIDGVYKNWGHIATRIKDGRLWSDGKIYATLEEYLKNHTPKYVGWGESINEVKVLEGGPEVRILNKGDVYNYFMDIYGKEPTQADYDVWIGRDLETFVNDKFRVEAVLARSQAQFVPYTGKQLFIKQ